VTKPSDRRLLRYARPARVYLAGIVVVTVAVAGLVIVQAQLLATAITGAFSHGLDFAALAGIIAALAGVVVGRAALAWALEALSYRASAGVKSQLRRDLLRRAVELGPRWLATRRAGELATLTTTGVDALDGYFAKYLPQVVLAVVIPLAVVARLLAADPLSGVIILVTLPLIPVFMGLVGATTAERTRRRWRELARLSHHFLDVVAGLPTLRVFGRAKAQAKTVAEVTGAYRLATLATLRLAFLSALVLELLASYSVALVAVAIGLRLQGGHLGLRTGLLVLILAPEAYLPLRQLASHYHASADGLAAAGDVFEVLDTQPAQPAPSAAVSSAAVSSAAVFSVAVFSAAGSSAAGLSVAAPSVAGLSVAARSVAARSVAVPSVSGTAQVAAVRVEDVLVRHAGRSQPAPNGVALRFAAGEIVALAGSSGSGKSTLIGVLLAFIAPDAGRVVIEDAAGERDLDQLDPRAWRALVGWVPQDPVLQHGTVESNIRLGQPDAPRAEVELAARRAALHEVALDRAVGEGGSGLSAGQRRRVAVARALLTDRPVLLLDEPTAGLDAAAEAQVLASVRELATDGRLVLMVAHRPAVLAAADRVVTLPAPAEIPAAAIPALAGSRDTDDIPAPRAGLPGANPGTHPGAPTGASV
jgi:ATP-binding cassette, subfamily C, bacterial CydCD